MCAKPDAFILVVGQYDNCLFSLHTPQSIGRTMEQDVKDSRWTRMVGAVFLIAHSKF